jgi:hypothetical protein
LIGSSTAPMWLMASASSMKAALFFISSATTSPLTMPVAASRPAVWRTR